MDTALFILKDRMKSGLVSVLDFGRVDLFLTVGLILLLRLRE